MSLLSYWQKAAESPVGISIKTNDRQLLRMQLYRTRAEKGGFENITIIFPEADDELWLIRDDTNSGSTPAQGDFEPL